MGRLLEARGAEGNEILVENWRGSESVFGAQDGKVGERRCPV